MLTLFTIEEKENSVFRRKFLRNLPVNSLKIEKREAGDMSLTHIRYINRNGSVNFKKIGRKAGRERFSLVCSEELLREGAPYVRAFNPSSYRARLCVNMGLACLESMKTVPKNFRVGFYDPLGEETDAAERILEYTDNFVAVTKNTPIYETLSEKLMWEKGVSLRLSRRVASLSSCHLIIAPAKLRDKFSSRTQAVILTCDTPSFPLLGRVYCKYELKLPAEIKKLCPEGFDEELLLSGLYSLSSQYSLGSLVPLIARNAGDTQTYISLGRSFIDTFST